MSRPHERCETGEQDLFRARLDQIINMTHELIRLAHEIDWLMPDIAATARPTVTASRS